MSSQKGNVARSRPQRHQNTFSFKNDKFDKSVQTKLYGGEIIEDKSSLGAAAIISDKPDVNVNWSSNFLGSDSEGKPGATFGKTFPSLCLSSIVRKSHSSIGRTTRCFVIGGSNKNSKKYFTEEDH
ncbi:uncharacterized protein C9orf85 homolog isoform X2 [Orcinus orca]|uniref:uncharacterized protein C9orf85 homolog isoform X2 n=1 Tax=Orcinus orca TaxID=9733 RepID=UPI001441B3EE|nr:uncharacterized protein C9orf85 homolog isoform X2 [Orcinus orca]